MKKIICIFLNFLIVFCIFGQIKNIDDYYIRKIDFYCNIDYKASSEMVEKEIKILDENKDSLEEEFFLTITNKLYTDLIYFNLVENKLSKDNKTKFAKLFLDQEKNCEDFMAGKEYKDLSADFLISLGDLKFKMPYVVSMGKYMPKVKLSKVLYENALINNPESVAGNCSKAMWFHFSPPIAGGSRKKALKIINVAEEKAERKEELFFVLVNKGQILKGLKKHEEASIAFKAAHELFPKEIYTKMLGEELNIKME